MPENTVEIPEEDMIEMAFFELIEDPNTEYISFTPCGFDEPNIGQLKHHVNWVTYEGDGRVHMEGDYDDVRVAEMLPASGGGKLEPPTNPPEPVYEEVEIMFTATVYMPPELGGQNEIHLEVN